MPFDPATRAVPIEPTDFASTVAPLVAADAPDEAASEAAVDGAAADGCAATDAGADVAPALLEQAARTRVSGSAARAIRRVRPNITMFSCLCELGEVLHPPLRRRRRGRFSPGSIRDVRATARQRRLEHVERRRSETPVTQRRYATDDVNAIELGIDRTVVTRWTPDDTWPALLDEYAIADESSADDDGGRPGLQRVGPGGRAADPGETV